MFKIFSSIIVSLFCMAQAQAQVQGVVLDSATKKPLDKVVVGLVDKTNITDTAYYFTNDKGIFIIDAVPAHNFSLVFTHLGFQPVATFFAIAKQEKTINVGQIILAQRPQLLTEVFVQAAPIVIKEDTIEYRADAFKVKENAMTEDLLKKLPGVTVDKDGNVTAQGKSVTKIRVNGKDFFGGDVKTATKEIPANMIDKVQVVDDYGDQANISGIKDGEPEKIINLQLKKDKNKGVFGRATIGGGTDGRYLASFNGNYFNNNQQISLFGNSNNTNQSLFNFGGGGNVGMSNMMKTGQRMMGEMGGGSGLMNAYQNGDQSFFSGAQNSGGITTSNSIGINYRDKWGKKINVYGSYSFGNKNNEALQTSATQTFLQSGNFLNTQNNVANGKGNNHRIFFNMEYQIDSFNYVKISPNITFSTSNNQSNTLFDLAQINGTKTSDGFNNSQTTASTPNYSATILYNHRFKKRGRNFSANVSVGTSQSNSDQNSQNNTNRYISPTSNFFQFQNIIQQNNNHNYGIRLTYSEPLSKTRNLDIAASHNLNYANNNRNTYDNNPVNSVPTLLPFLSNNFENDFYSNRVGISVRTTQKKYNYTLGISVQPVSLQGKSLTNDSAYKTINRVNVFPIARFTYNFSKMKAFAASYSGNATQPTFTQLQDVLDISNQQAATKGNPFLKPAINHNINISFNDFNIVTGRVVFTNITFSTIQNQIINNIISRGGLGAQLSMPENVQGYFNVGGFYTFSKPFKKRKYVLTLNGNVNYNHNINLVDSIRNIGQNWIASQGFIMEYNYKTWLEFGLGASYSINDVKYIKPAGAYASNLQNTSSSALTITSNIDIDLKEKWILKYNFDYTINYGLDASVNANFSILNASIERQFFKKKNGVIKLAAYDIFNQNTNISRNVTANSIVDSRTNRLARYFLLTFTYRLQKFKGQKPKKPGFPGMGTENKNAEIKVF